MVKKKEAKTEKSKEDKKMPERAKVEDIEALVTDLAKQGNHPAKIGRILREKHGVYKIKLLGKTITKILKDNNLTYNDDLAFVNKKINSIENHHIKNKQDKRAMREVVRFIGLKKKLEKYKSKSI